MPCSCRPRTRQAPARITRDSGGTPKPLLQKMIREVLQTGLDAPIVFAGDEHEPVSAADLARKPFKWLGRFALRIFLVHPVEHRETDCFGIDQLNVVAPVSQLLDHVLSQPDTHSIGTVGAIKEQGCGCSWQTSVGGAGPGKADMRFCTAHVCF